MKQKQHQYKVNTGDGHHFYVTSFWKALWLKPHMVAFSKWLKPVRAMVLEGLIWFLITALLLALIGAFRFIALT